MENRRKRRQPFWTLICEIGRHGCHANRRLLRCIGPLFNALRTSSVTGETDHLKLIDEAMHLVVRPAAGCRKVLSLLSLCVCVCVWQRRVSRVRRTSKRATTRLACRLRHRSAAPCRRQHLSHLDSLQHFHAVKHPPVGQVFQLGPQVVTSAPKMRAINMLFHLMASSTSTR